MKQRFWGEYVPWVLREWWRLDTNCIMSFWMDAVCILRRCSHWTVTRYECQGKVKPTISRSTWDVTHSIQHLYVNINIEDYTSDGLATNSSHKMSNEGIYELRKFYQKHESFPSHVAKHLFCEILLRRDLYEYIFVYETDNGRQIRRVVALSEC